MARWMRLKTGFMLAMALVMLMISWESHAGGTALAVQSIPEQAIRIRIIAHSDAVQDQWIKREIQQAIAATLAEEPGLQDSLEEARAAIAARLPEWDALIAELLGRYGYTYGHDIVHGQVEFPAKLYNKQVYPAGQYEAVRITLGSGNGQNWWCVLFPPLCLGVGTVKATDGAVAGVLPAGEAGAGGETGDGASSEGKSADGKSAAGDEGGGEQAADKSDEGWRSAVQEDGEQPEVRFFLADVAKSVKHFFKDLLA